VDSLTGVLCDTPVIFTCNTFEPVLLLEWYIDDSPLVSYTYRGEKLPVRISTINNSMLNAEVVISSVSVNNTSGNVYYGNVTLATSLTSLTQFRNSNISCGSYFHRSNFVHIGDYSLYGKNGFI